MKVPKLRFSVPEFIRKLAISNSSIWAIPGAGNLYHSKSHLDTFPTVKKTMGATKPFWHLKWNNAAYNVFFAIFCRRWVEGYYTQKVEGKILNVYLSPCIYEQKAELQLSTGSKPKMPSSLCVSSFTGPCSQLSTWIIKWLFYWTMKKHEYMQNNKKLKYLSYLVNEISAPEPQRTASAHQGCMPSPSSLHRIASCHLWGVRDVCF